MDNRISYTGRPIRDPDRFLATLPRMGVEKASLFCLDAGGSGGMTLAIVTTLAVLAVMLATYLMFRVIGTRRHTLLLTADEKSRWDDTVVRRVGNPLVVASLVGTLTSLATAYLFFIGTSKVFGYWILVCPVSIFVGGFVTNRITSRVLSSEHLRSRITGLSQQSGVIARLFWTSDVANMRVSRAVKWISIISIAGIIWLEFALFSDVLGLLLGIDQLLIRASICGFSAFVVTHFTIRFGLRGFVFADAFHSPLLVLAAIAIAVTTAVHFAQSQTTPFDGAVIRTLVTPLVDTTSGLLFVGHVLVLNAFLVVFTEAHWLRLWALTERPVISQQLAGTGSTALVWLVLSVCGLLAFGITGTVGENAVADLLARFGENGIVAVTIFWLGAAAALFSTADTQIYSLLLVSRFDPLSGQIDDAQFANMRPALIAGIAAALFFGLYWAARESQVPFEKIIFIIIPFTLNLMPAFAALLFRRRPSALLVTLSLLGYMAFATLGFLQAADEFTMTLSASLVPIVVSLFVWLCPRESVENGR